MDSIPAMAERGKDVETYENFYDFNYPASDIKCEKHPYPSSVGVCAYCLKERLVKLVCPECEQRLSLCSCSDNSSSYRNSCSIIEIGSVGRISFLLEKQNIEFQQHSMSNPLRRSGSNGFWKIKRLFRKRKRKGCVKNGEIADQIWVSEVLDAENGGIDPNRGAFAAKESDFGAMDEAEFFDLKLDFLSESEQDLSGCDHRTSCKSESFKNGGSCRTSMNERGSEKGRRRNKVWEWIF